MKKIAIMGHGVVGSGVAEVFFKNYENIKRKIRDDAEIKYILDLRDFPSLTYSDKFTKNFDDILNDPEISLFVETMGGLEPAYTFVKKCLLNKKSVVTSNKELVAEKGAELLAIAKNSNVKFLFEASVGGGIPIIRPLSQCLAANDILEINGILNGTTNYILTNMVKESVDFDCALRQAQSLGYAERDPSADILGLDASRKICILASIAYGKHVYPKYVFAQGITQISLADLEYAKLAGGSVKLIASAKLLDSGKIAVETSPAFIPYSNPLSSVDDVFNAVHVRGNNVGDVTFIGRGAGKLPTASAVMSDVIEALARPDYDPMLSWNDSGSDFIIPLDSISHRFYLRLTSSDFSRLDTIIKNSEKIAQSKTEVALISAQTSYSELSNISSLLADAKITVASAFRVLE